MLQNFFKIQFISLIFVVLLLEFRHGRDEDENLVNLERGQPSCVLVRTNMAYSLEQKERGHGGALMLALALGSSLSTTI